MNGIIREGHRIPNGFSIKTDGNWDWTFNFRLGRTLYAVRKRGNLCAKRGISPKWFYFKITLTEEEVICSQLLHLFGWSGVTAMRRLQADRRVNTTGAIYMGEKEVDDLVFRLIKRAEIRRQIQTRKSVQEGQPDRISDLLEEAATEIILLRGSKEDFDYSQQAAIR